MYTVVLMDRTNLWGLSVGDKAELIGWLSVFAGDEGELLDEQSTFLYARSEFVEV